MHINKKHKFIKETEMARKKEPLELTPATIQAMLAGGNDKNKDIRYEISADLKMHAYGIMPKRLIDERRPNESEAVKKYRAQIYVPVTKATMTKVFNCLEKIRRSQDWNIQYDANAVSKRIKPNETLERYCEEKYPAFGSLTNWTFSILLKKYLLDPNGIIAIIPTAIPEAADEYIQPMAEFFDSEQIKDYVEGEYVVLESRDTSTYKTNDGKTVNTQGKIYHVLTTTQYARYEQNAEEGYGLTQMYNHNIGELPAFHAGGLFHARVNNDTIYESRIAGMVPSLNEAAREYSDLQAEILQHIHSEKWAFANVECPVCHGMGKVYKKDENGNDTEEMEECPQCHGRGSISNVSPYGLYTINAQRFGEASIPAPPMGYVSKDTAIAAFAHEHFKQHLKDALAAVNMEFLAESPMSQSGTAKAYDKDELNNFVNGIAEDLVRILDLCYFFINEYRNMLIEPNEEDRRKMLPQINVPTKYDILTTTALMEELKAAKEAKVNPLIIRRLEIDYAKKQFNTDPEVAHLIEATFDLDPMFGKTEEEKMTMLQNKGVTELNYIISSNVAAFVQRAVKESPDFLQLDHKQQLATLTKYAEEVQTANQPKQNPLLQNIIDETKE